MDTQFKVGDLVRRVGFIRDCPWEIGIEGKIFHIDREGKIASIRLTKNAKYQGVGSIKNVNTTLSIWELVNPPKYPPIKTKFLEGYNGI